MNTPKEIKQKIKDMELELADSIRKKIIDIFYDLKPWFKVEVSSSKRGFVSEIIYRHKDKKFKTQIEIEIDGRTGGFIICHRYGDFFLNAENLYTILFLDAANELLRKE